MTTEINTQRYHTLLDFGNGNFIGQFSLDNLVVILRTFSLVGYKLNTINYIFLKKAILWCPGEP